MPGLLAGWDTGRILRFANAAGAWVAARVACADAMPTAAEVEDWLVLPEPYAAAMDPHEWYLPRGSTAAPVVLRGRAGGERGWAHTSLRVLEGSAAGGRHSFATGGEEVVVLPLSGSATCSPTGPRIRADRPRLGGRPGQ